LVAGNYAVLTNDAVGCVATDTVEVTSPDQLDVSLTPSDYSGWNISCDGGNDGSIAASVSGGAGGYTYSWSPSGGSSATATGLSSNTYTVTVSDANSCSVNVIQNMIEPDPLTFTNSVGFICSGSTYVGATISVNPSGGASGVYEYRLGAGSWQLSNELTGITTNGNYTVQVRDASNTGCSASQSVNVTFPAPGTVLDACEFIYVSPSGDPAGTLGQKDCPVTLPQAISIYGGDPTRNHILMLEGSYTYTQKYQSRRANNRWPVH